MARGASQRTSALFWLTSLERTLVGESGSAEVGNDDVRLKGLTLDFFFLKGTAYWYIFLPLVACSPLRHWWHRCKSDRACRAADEWRQRTCWVKWPASGVLSQPYWLQLGSRSLYNQSPQWEEQSRWLWSLHLKLCRTVGPSETGLFLQTGGGGELDTQYEGHFEVCESWACFRFMWMSEHKVHSRVTLDKEAERRPLRRI